MSGYLHRRVNANMAAWITPQGGVVPEESAADLPAGKAVLPEPRHVQQAARVAVAIMAATATFAQGTANGGGLPPDNYTCIGPNSPSEATNDNSVGVQPWGGEANALSSNDSYADAEAGSNSQSQYLVVTDFSLNVPDGATILDVKVRIERKRLVDPDIGEDPDTASVTDAEVRLVVGGSVTGDNKAKADVWGTSDATIEYGGGLWGTSLTPAQVNADNFGVALSVNLFATAGQVNAFAYVDHITVTVCYGLPNDGNVPERPQFSPRDVRRTIPFPSGVVLNAQVPPEEVQTANIAPLIVQPPPVAARAPEGAYWISQPFPDINVVDAAMPPGLIQVDTPKFFISPQPVLQIPILQGGAVGLEFRPHGWQFNMKNADHALRLLTTKHPYPRRSIIRAVGNGTNGLPSGVVQIDWLNGTALAHLPDHITDAQVGDTVFSIVAVDGTGRSDAPTFLVLAKIAGSGDQISGDFCGT